MLNLFRATNRSAGGCWTCRLRRKKCSEDLPACAACAALDIQCVYDDTRPAWMDGGAQQKARAAQIKREIKDRAAWRRERRVLRGLVAGASGLQLGEEKREKRDKVKDKVKVKDKNEPGPRHDDEVPRQTPRQATTHVFAVAGTGLETPTASTPGSTTDATKSACELAAPSLEQERDLNLVMLYLDYVFPFLYPFCRPRVLGAGRGWLLVLLLKNRAVFHAALSLSSFFMAVVAATQAQTQVAAESAQHAACLAGMHDEVNKQQDLCLRELQRSVAGFSPGPSSSSPSSHSSPSSPSSPSLGEAARVLESILQLLTFEGVLQRLDLWHGHLDAAVSLFEQHIMAEGGNGQWACVLHALSAPAWAPGAPGASADAGASFGSDAAALAFHTALLLFADIVTSTTVAQAPRLQRFHGQLIRSDANSATATATDALCLEEVVGVRNWVLLALADAAALAAWKQTSDRSSLASDLSDLASRAAPIEADLRARLATLDDDMQREPARPDDNPGFYASYVVAAEGQMAALEAGEHPASASAMIDSAAHLGVAATTRLWAHAVLAFLLATVHGVQPDHPQIRAAADLVVHGLAALPSATCLRVAAWPLCIAGCLATRSQRDLFRGMVAQMCGRAFLFGSVNDALRLAEAVWAMQDAGATDLDLGRCLGLLGRHAYLF